MVDKQETYREALQQIIQFCTQEQDRLIIHARETLKADLAHIKQLATAGQILGQEHIARCRHLEAKCAEMREALEQAPDLYECAYYVGFNSLMGYKEMQQRWAGEAQEILVNMQQALCTQEGVEGEL